MAVKQKTEQKKDTFNIGIGTENRAKVVEILNQLLADEMTLYVKLRNYHWNVLGIHFKSLHEFFEEQYTDLEVKIDDIAERIRSLDHFSPGTMAEFRDLARLSETGNLNGNAPKMLENIAADHETIIQILRHDVNDTIEKYNDAGTGDFLTALMEDHEKMLWMVRSHIEK